MPPRDRRVCSIPKGLCPPAQGCEPRAILGELGQKDRTPRGGGAKRGPGTATPLGLAAADSRSADLQSAVSQVCNLLASPSQEGLQSAGRCADYKSAIRQITNLRYITWVWHTSQDLCPAALRERAEVSGMKTPDSEQPRARNCLAKRHHVLTIGTPLLLFGLRTGRPRVPAPHPHQDGTAQRFGPPKQSILEQRNVVDL